MDPEQPQPPPPPPPPQMTDPAAPRGTSNKILGLPTNCFIALAVFLLILAFGAFVFFKCLEAVMGDIH